jgi:integrase/recombinase XerD
VLEDALHLAGHAEPRTTTLYDRRKKKVTRNVVERIPI